ncbi:MAG TPA: glycosyltransferase [Candidatus Saccharimonadales bacterium]|nr:glycosyltransferase [Candidatus Saccharimonadales bacterium]
MQPVISVIIPCLNEEHYLPLLLEDLKNQTDKSFEVIVVDGHSNDKTKERALSFKKDLQLHFIECPKRNTSLQRNTGAQKAKGEYLFFLDADTRIAKDAMKNAIRHIRSEKHELYLPIISSSNPKLRYRVVVKFVITAVKFLHIVGRPFSIGPLILIKKELFDKIGGFNLNLTISEDHNLILTAHKFGVKAYFLSDVNCVFSMRRFERDGLFRIFWKYSFFTAETLLRGGISREAPSYEMGGHNYDKPSFSE